MLDTRLKRNFDIAFFAAGIGTLALFTTRYRMPFRLDDVVIMLWAKTHFVLDAFDPVNGQMINSFRPVFTLTAFFLTHWAGWDHPFWWHLTLDLTLLTGIAFMGLTARYLIGRWYALQISTLLYWLAFLPILNIFFWYSDLTFGLEIAFTASAWYFGLRGLYEARIGFWLLGMLLGSLAVLSKEPAFVLVHVVLLGSFLLERNRIVEAWESQAAPRRSLCIAAYGILLGVTIWVAFVSPTRANRFFSFHAPNLPNFIRDRIEYYSAIYLSVTARLLLFSPFVYAFLRTTLERRIKLVLANQFLFLSFLAIIIAMLLFQNLLIALSLLTFMLLTLATFPNSEQQRVRRLLPFLACLMIAMGVLMFTIQLVKTQLTEAALLTALLSSWAWCIWIEDFRRVVIPYRAMMPFRWIALPAGFLISAAIAIGIGPQLLREERLLGEVRDVRQNANDAVYWAAINLPAGSLLAVTEYSLYGIEGPGVLTPKDDEIKLVEQYTFDAGFLFDGLAVLGRTDFCRTYLADSLLLTRVLNAMRTEPHSYVLLQSKLDVDRFHGKDGREPLLSIQDSLVAHFSRGPYPCEIWLLRH